jgi:hypothetical protein
MRVYSVTTSGGEEGIMFLKNTFGDNRSRLACRYWLVMIMCTIWQRYVYLYDYLDSWYT